MIKLARKTKLFIGLLVCCAFGSKAETRYMDAEVTGYGELEQVVGGQWNCVDSLVVRGPIDENDFKFLWKCGCYGELKSLNLEFADVKDKKIPDYAFYSDAFPNSEGKMNLVGITKYILPDDIEEIGEAAFYHDDLEYINIPKSLRKLNIGVFMYSNFEGMDELFFPAGVEDIPGICFCGVKNLRKLTLPSTLKTISEFAFRSADVKNVVFPDGLESVGYYAFMFSKIEDVYLPDSCNKLSERSFAECLYLKRIRFSKNLEEIPLSLAFSCIRLESVEFPEKLDRICEEAFSACENLKSIRLPESLTYVGKYAFSNCKSLSSVYLGSNVALLDDYCFADPAITEIYCGAISVPMCSSDVNTQDMADGMCATFKYVNADIPVYVRRGMADAYRNAYGWDHFTNFIEIDDFPEVGGVSAVSDGGARAYAEGGTLRIVSDAGAVEYCVYSIDGRVAARGCSSNVALPLDSGTYIVKYSGKSLKIKM
jgi:hypothetical protein